MKNVTTFATVLSAGSWVISTGNSGATRRPAGSSKRNWPSSYSTRKHSLISGTRKCTRRRTGAAETHLRRALALGANMRLAHLDLGILFAAKNDSDEAVRQFREAVRLDPSKPDAHYRLGRLYSSLGREQDARDEFDKVQKLAAEKPLPPLLSLPGRRIP
jgi:tetratricopeptide (TPR) repeat protein